MTTTPRPWPNLVIRASAGTGKTFQLSNRYLQLVADGQAPETILAATFARKAAGEILSRVLVRLAEAALDAGRCRELAKSLDRQLDREASRALLRKLLSNLHRLGIGTLDSFFVQLAMSFTLELGLPTGWEILEELDDEQLRLEAIRRVLEGSTPSEASSLVQLVFKGLAARSITQQIADIAAELYGVYCESDGKAWHALPRPPVLKDNVLASAVAALTAAPAPSDKRFAAAWQKDIERAQREAWEEFLSTGLAACISRGEPLYYRKPIEPPLVALYEPLVKHARGVVVGKIVNQTEGTYQLLAAFAAEYAKLKQSRRGLRFDDVPRLLVDALEEGLDGHAPWRLDAKLSHLLIDEFQDTSLAQWRVLRPFARACSDATLGHSFFCVGDVKQAIYGWRGGVSQIFTAASGELTGIEQQSLAKSYRSSPVIIDTVNQIFSRLTGNEALADFAEVATAWHEQFEKHDTVRRELAGHAALWVAPRAGIDEQQTIVTQTYAAGQVARLARERPGHSIGVLVRRNVAVGRLIHLLRSEHNIPASEEGGNPLTDSPAVQLLLSLLQLADHPGDGAARFHVANSPLAAPLNFADHADDRRAAELAQQLRRELLEVGYGRTVYRWVGWLAPVCSERDLRRLRQLVELAYGFDEQARVRPSEFVSLIQQRRVEDPATAQVRVMTVHQAKGLEFDIVVLPELDVDLKPAPSSVAIGRSGPLAPIERVCRHVSQELRPLLPPAYQAMFDVAPSEAVNESLCLAYVALSRAIHAMYLIVAPTRLKQGGQPGTFPKTFAGLVRWGLVGQTTLQPETTAWQTGDPDWFQRSMEKSGAAKGARAAGAETGASTNQEAQATPVEAEPLIVKLRETSSRSRQRERRSPSRLEGGGRVRLVDHLRSQQNLVFARGSLWHAWLEQITWLDGAEAMPDRQRLLALGRGVAAGLDVSRELDHFLRLLDGEVVRAALSRQAYSDPVSLGLPKNLAARLAVTPHELRLYRERRFAVHEEVEAAASATASTDDARRPSPQHSSKGSPHPGPLPEGEGKRPLTPALSQGERETRSQVLLTGSVDRLVLWVDDQGQALAADVLDFKSDRQTDPDAVAQMIEFYRPQLQAYRRAVARLYRLSPEYVTSRIVLLEAGLVKRIE